MSLYVYALVDRPGRARTIAGHRIEVRRIAGMHLAIERVAAAPAVSAAALRVQHAIVERLAVSFKAVLPARFGASLAEQELEQMIRLRSGVLRKSLRRIAGRAQMTVRIMVPPTHEPNVADTAAVAPGTAYLNARRLTSSLAHVPLAATVSASVRALAKEERVESDAGQGRVALFHLIDRGEAGLYRREVTKVAVPSGSRVTVTGPFPPFAFAPDLWP